MVLVATTSKPVLPTMVVDTSKVDVSDMSNAPNATLVAAIDTVLVSLMAISADEYLTASTDMVLVSLMLAAPIA
jgi:hypothetical protein